MAEFCATCGRPAKWCIRQWDGFGGVKHEPACGYHKNRYVSPAYARWVDRPLIKECRGHTTSTEVNSMTVEEIRKRIKEIKGIRESDWEAKHGMEDQLRHDVLRAIADGASDPAALAKEVLKTSLLDFRRECA